MPPQNIIIGLCGASGSGKTTIVTRIQKLVADESVVLSQDSYYRCLAALPPDERNRNFDVPEAIDLELMASHLRELSAGRPVGRPEYDFTTHTRLSPTVTVEPAKVIFLEGTLIFHESWLRDLFDLKVFLDCALDVALLRRIIRDSRERARTLDDIEQQYLSTVRPMYFRYVAPQKAYADVVIDSSGSVSDEQLTDLLNRVFKGSPLE